MGHNGALFRDQDEVLVAHDLRHGRGHLGGQAGGKMGQLLRSHVEGQEPISEFSDGEGRDGSKSFRVVGVHDEARDFVVLVGNDRLFDEMRQRDVGERELGGDAFFGGVGGDARELVAAAFGRGLRHKLAQGAE